MNGHHAGLPAFGTPPFRAYLAVMLFVLLAGCSAPWSSGSSARRSPTPLPSPTATPSAVPAMLTLAQQGLVETHTLQFVTTLTVTNRRSDAIEIIGLAPNSPHYATFEIFTALYHTKVWDNRVYTNCSPFGCGYPFLAVAPGASQTWMATLDMSKVGGFLPGIKVQVEATVYWVPVAALDDPNAEQESTVGQAEITVT